MNKLRQMRMARWLTVSELSQATRIERDQIRYYEMGTEITKEDREKLEAFFGESV